MIRQVNVRIRHPGEGRGPVTQVMPVLDTGMRRYDVRFILHQAGAIE